MVNNLLHIAPEPPYGLLIGQSGQERLDFAKQSAS